MSKRIGRKCWIFSDGELPPLGDFALKGHESVIILNTTNEPAICHLTIYFTDKDPVTGIEVVVQPQRVRCIRMNDTDALQDFVIPQEVQYAMKWDCSVPVIMQYGRLDTRDQPMHFYINQSYAE